MEGKQEWKIKFEWPNAIPDSEAEQTGLVLADNIVRAVRAALSRLGDGRGNVTVTSPPRHDIVDETVFSLAYQIRRHPTGPANESTFASLSEAEAAIESYYRVTPPEQAFPLYAYRDAEDVWRLGREMGRPGIVGEYQTREEAWDELQYNYDSMSDDLHVVSCVKATTTRSSARLS